MSEGMLGKAVKELVALPEPMLGTAYDLLLKLGDPEWDAAAKRFLRKENPWPDQVLAATAALLEPVTTVTIPALSAFNVAAHFAVTPEDKRKNAEVLIGHMGGNVLRLVQNRTEPEPEIAETTLRVQKLRQGSDDGPILAELGEKATTTWGQIYEIMRRQGRGQKGVLLTNGWWIVFYITDTDGTVRAVRCSWGTDGRGWYVNANPVAHPYAWDAGRQVVSR